MLSDNDMLSTTAIDEVSEMIRVFPFEDEASIQSVVVFEDIEEGNGSFKICDTTSLPL